MRGVGFRDYILWALFLWYYNTYLAQNIANKSSYLIIHKYVNKTIQIMVHRDKLRGNKYSHD